MDEEEEPYLTFEFHRSGKVEVWCQSEITTEELIEFLRSLPQPQQEDIHGLLHRVSLRKSSSQEIWPPG